MKLNEIKKLIRKEIVEIIKEKAVSKAQQQAAGIALAAKRGDIPKSKLKGASKEMEKMPKKDLADFAKTKHKGLPSKKESVNERIKFGGSFDHNEVMDILDIAAQYSSTQHQAANQQWWDAQDLYDYLKSDHIPKKYHKDFYKAVKRKYKVNENYEINEKRDKKVTKKMWDRAWKNDYEKREQALLTVFKDPDDAEEWIDMNFDDLPSQASHMTIYESVNETSYDSYFMDKKVLGPNYKNSQLHIVAKKMFGKSNYMKLSKQQQAKVLATFPDIKESVNEAKLKFKVGDFIKKKKDGNLEYEIKSIKPKFNAVEIYLDVTGNSTMQTFQHINKEWELAESVVNEAYEDYAWRLEINPTRGGISPDALRKKLTDAGIDFKEERKNRWQILAPKDGSGSSEAKRLLDMNRFNNYKIYESVNEDLVELFNESGILYKAGIKKYGKEGMTKILQAAGKKASHAEIGKIKDKYEKGKKESAELDEASVKTGWKVYKVYDISSKLWKEMKYDLRDQFDELVKIGADYGVFQDAQGTAKILKQIKRLMDKI